MTRHEVWLCTSGSVIGSATTGLIRDTPDVAHAAADVVIAVLVLIAAWFVIHYKAVRA